MPGIWLYYVMSFHYVVDEEWIIYWGLIWRRSHSTELAKNEHQVDYGLSDEDTS